MKNLNENESDFIDALRKSLHYDPRTGLFLWKIKRKGKVQSGQIAGGIDSSTGYWRIRFQQKNFQAHRLAWIIYYGELPRGVIDHINGNKTDNRITNLRDVNRSVNLHNQSRAQKGNVSGFLGVSYQKRNGKYLARITKDNVTKQLGVFTTPEAAYEAYLLAKSKLEGALDKSRTLG